MFYFEYQTFNLIGGEINMCNIPKDCVNCIYEMRCDSALNMEGCRYCGLLDEKRTSIVDRLKNYFGKFFK